MPPDEDPASARQNSKPSFNFYQRLQATRQLAWSRSLRTRLFAGEWLAKCDWKQISTCEAGRMLLQTLSHGQQSDFMLQPNAVR